MQWIGTWITLGCLVALAFSLGSSQEEATLPAGQFGKGSGPMASEKRGSPLLATRPAPTDSAPTQIAHQAAPEAALPAASEHVLRGRVTDRDGHGVARIAVQITFSSRARRAPVLRDVETGPDGRFATPVPPRADVARVWARGTERWITHPAVTATGWGQVMWYTSRGEKIMLGVQGRPGKPGRQTAGAWPEVELHAQPARTLHGRVVPRLADEDTPDLRVLVRAHWLDPRYVKCMASVYAEEDGSFALHVPCAAAGLTIGILVRTREDWADDRGDLLEPLAEEGADDETILAALNSVQRPHPGFWLSDLEVGEDNVLLYLFASHEVEYTLSVDGRPVRPREAFISMSLVHRENGDGRHDDWLDVRPCCGVSGASDLVAGRYRLTVTSVARSSGVPAFSGSRLVNVPGPPVAVECRRP